MNEVVEILLATMNGARYLREQLDSILSQTDGNWHLTISDDGSTDDTNAIIDEYVQRYSGKVMRHDSSKHFGNARDHFFYLMNCCDAEYMLFCDQDDVWYPDKVKKTREALLNAERECGADTPILVFSDQTPTDANLIPLASSLMRYQKQYFKCFDYRSILMQNVVTGGAMGINRALAKLARRCDDTSQIIMHDWWLAVVAARFGKIMYIDEPLGAYRQHGNNAVGAKNVNSIGHIVRRMMDTDGIRRVIREKKAQARQFYGTFETMMSAENDAFLLEYIRPRSGPLFYWRYRSEIHGLFRLMGMMAFG